MPAIQKVYFPVLTGFRALAAFMVFIFHANPFAASGWQRHLYLFTQQLHVGVSFFFILSGFLLYARYENESHGRHWLMYYMRNRFARIFPLYFVLTLVTFGALFVSGNLPFNGENFFILLTNLTFLKGFFNDLKFSGIAQGWSLTIEACFYILIPWIFFWTRKHNIVYLTVPFIAVGALLVFTLGQLDFYGCFEDLSFMMVYTFFGRCFEFFAGVWLAMNFKKIAAATKRFPITYYGIFISVAVVALMAATENLDWGYPLRIVLNNFFMPCATGALLYGLISEQTAIRKILSSRIFDVLGKSSYAFFLIHAGVFYIFITRYVGGNPIMIFIVLNILAIGLYYFIERPLNGFVKSHFQIGERKVEAGKIKIDDP